jgi:hypothetical protein
VETVFLMAVSPEAVKNLAYLLDGLEKPPISATMNACYRGKPYTTAATWFV